MFKLAVDPVDRRSLPGASRVDEAAFSHVPE